MRQLLLASSLVLATVVAGTAFAAKSPEPSVPSPAAQASRAQLSPAASDAVQVVNTFLEALAGGRLEAARQLMTPDAVVLANGQVLGERDVYINGAAKGDVAALGNFQRELLRRDVKAGANLGWVVSETSLHPSTGQGPDQLVTETMLLARTAEGWKITHIHWSGRRAG
jgi:ketosteroid isomerase-like protein